MPRVDKVRPQHRRYSYLSRNYLINLKQECTDKRDIGVRTYCSSYPLRAYFVAYCILKSLLIRPESGSQLLNADVRRLLNRLYLNAGLVLSTLLQESLDGRFWKYFVTFSENKYALQLSQQTLFNNIVFCETCVTTFLNTFPLSLTLWLRFLIVFWYRDYVLICIYIYIQILYIIARWSV